MSDDELSRLIVAVEELVTQVSRIVSVLEKSQPEKKPLKPVAPLKVTWGHGHVYPRIDGAKARCGGPGMCGDCSKDLAALNAK